MRGRAAGAPARRATVRDVMTRQVLCVSPEQPLAEVASLMSNKDVDRVPVVREGRLVGFLTRGDIVRKLIGTDGPSSNDTWLATARSRSSSPTPSAPARRGRSSRILEEKGFRVVAARVMHLTEAQAGEFYAVHTRAPVLRRARRVHDVGPVHADGAREGRRGRRAARRRSARPTRPRPRRARCGSCTPSRRGGTRSTPRTRTRTRRARRGSSSPRRSCSGG